MNIEIQRGETTISLLDDLKEELGKQFRIENCRMRCDVGFEI